jgi:PIN domain nuclease of toxin-antitoxin system
VIFCWEVAKLIELKRISFEIDVHDWINQALSYPGIQLIEFSPRIAVESTKLPGEFHRDPADQIIVATARVHDCPLLTMDQKILDYKHVKFIKWDDAKKKWSRRKKRVADFCVRQTQLQFYKEVLWDYWMVYLVTHRKSTPQKFNRNLARFLRRENVLSMRINSFVTILCLPTNASSWSTSRD